LKADVSRVDPVREIACVKYRRKEIAAKNNTGHARNINKTLATHALDLQEK
jgi:hypothetical protein